MVDARRTTTDRRPSSLWISWEHHRRSRELAAHLGADLHEMDRDGGSLVRYAVLGWKTLRILLRERPRLVYCQNPSMVLAAFLCAVKRPLRFALVVDRHSNFKLDTVGDRRPRYRIFHALSRYTIRRADLTLVTNRFLLNLVEEQGGRGEILQDKMPDMGAPAPPDDTEGDPVNVVYVSTFSHDEPTRAVIEAGAALREDGVRLFITGKHEGVAGIETTIADLPDNVRLTGFLSDHDYRALLAGADIVMVITTLEHTLTCGAYEAMALGKPMVLSDKAAIRDYFSQGATYAGGTPESIVAALRGAIADRASLSAASASHRARLVQDWQERADRVERRVAGLVPSARA